LPSLDWGIATRYRLPPDRTSVKARAWILHAPESHCTNRFATSAQSSSGRQRRSRRARGVRVWIGDELNGLDAEAALARKDAAWTDDASLAHWLHETALRLYPDSDYARRHRD
jgi:hypothetical protein